MVTRAAGLIALGVMVVAVMAVNASADIKADTFMKPLDVTNAGSGQFRTWAAFTQTGAVLSRRDTAQSDGTSIWTNHGAGTAGVSSYGVAAASFTESGNINELVVYVGTDNKLNVGRIINNGAIAWTALDPPLSRTLTGNVAAVTFLQSTTRYLLVGATTTDGHLFRYVGIVNSNFGGGWTDSSAGLSWLTYAPLSASASPDETIANFFAAHTLSSESLGMVRWNGSTWATTNLGRPTGKRACRTLAAAEGNLTGLSGGEKVLVACTPAVTAGEIYIALSSGYNSTSFAWTTYASPSGTWHQGVGAVFHLTSLVRNTGAIDVYLTGSTPSDNRLEKGVQSSSSFSISDLGLTPDGGSLKGSPSAIASGTTSRAFFVNSQATRTYLYERYGGNTTSAAQNYRAFGDVGWDSLGNTSFAEGKIGVWQGTMAAAVLNRPGTGGIGDWPRTYLLFSQDEGEAAWAPQQITNVVGSTTFNFVSDPTAVVTDQRTIYAVQEGVEIAQCSSNSTQLSNAVYLVSTSAGTWPTISAPILIEQRSGPSIDHPYADIQHRSGLADLVHIAWWRIGSGIGYTAFVEGSTTPVIKTLLSTGANPPRVTAADSGRVIVYFPLSNGQVQFCEVYDTNADGVPDSCCINGASCGDSGWQTVDPGPQRQDGSFPLKWSTPGGGLGGPGVSGGNIYIRAAFPIAMAISESGDTLYYCFHQNETNGPGPDADTREETDAYCTTGTRDPATGLWSWNTNPVLLSGGTRNDDKDQFAPEVVLTQEQGSYTAGRETAIITFYDRSDDTSNHNYKVKKTVSTDRLASAFPPRAMFNGNTSDPAYLPRHCFDSNTRFIGDYAGAEGHVVHAQSISVTVPTPGTIGAAMNANFNALGHWNR